MIAPARGYEVGFRPQSIREAFGLPVKPLVLWVACPSLDNLPQQCIHDIAVLAGAQGVVRGVSKRLAAAWRL